MDTNIVTRGDGSLLRDLGKECCQNDFPRVRPINPDGESGSDSQSESLPACGVMDPFNVDCGYLTHYFGPSPGRQRRNLVVQVLKRGVCRGDPDPIRQDWKSEASRWE